MMFHEIMKGISCLKKKIEQETQDIIKNEQRKNTIINMEDFNNEIRNVIYENASLKIFNLYTFSPFLIYAVFLIVMVSYQENFVNNFFYNVFLEFLIALIALPMVFCLKMQNKIIDSIIGNMKNKLGYLIEKENYMICLQKNKFLLQNKEDLEFLIAQGLRLQKNEEQIIVKKQKMIRDELPTQLLEVFKRNNIKSKEYM